MNNTSHASMNVVSLVRRPLGRIGPIKSYRTRSLVSLCSASLSRATRPGIHTANPKLTPTVLNGRPPLKLGLLRQVYAPTRQRSMAHAQKSYDAVVVGAGPAGVTAVGNLLDQGLQKILWVDPDFHGGRIDKKYREVPSNTKVSLFIDFAEATQFFRKVLKDTSEPNAITALKDLPGDKGCRLSYAADMVVTLTDGLRKMNEIDTFQGKLTAASQDSSLNWSVSLSGSNNPLDSSPTAPRLIFCTGSTPLLTPPPIKDVTCQTLDLDTALAPSILRPTIPTDSSTTIAVIGSSHSAILVLLNLCELAQSTHPNLRVKWFTRSSLKFAVYMDGWILYDNTGLKGEAAQWARENLTDERLPTSPAGRVIEKIDLPRNDAAAEATVYEQHLPSCSHIVQAIGYKRESLPKLDKQGKELMVQSNPLTGTFVDEKGEPVKGLFGAGIAFPERVTDPYGNVEYAVGFFKFMKFLKKVSPAWIALK